MTGQFFPCPTCGVRHGFYEPCPVTAPKLIYFPITQQQPYPRPHRAESRADRRERE